MIPNSFNSSSFFFSYKNCSGISRFSQSLLLENILLFKMSLRSIKPNSCFLGIPDCEFCHDYVTWSEFNFENSEMLFDPETSRLCLRRRNISNEDYRLSLKLIGVVMISIVYSLFTTNTFYMSHLMLFIVSQSLPAHHASIYHLQSLVYTVNVMMRHLLYLKNEPFFYEID